MLKDKGAVFLQTEGKLAGCWVMTIDDDGRGADRRDGPARTRPQRPPRTRSRARRSSCGRTARSPTSARTWPTSSGSSGCSARTSTIARFAARLDGGTLWATTSQTSEARRPRIRRSARRRDRTTSSTCGRPTCSSCSSRPWPRPGIPTQARALTHFSYEMVALSHATARELGFAPAAGSEEAAKPFVEVSGRKGLGVKADDLLDRLIDKAVGEVARRNPELPAAERGRPPSAIAVAAVRYFMVKFSRDQGHRLRHRRGAELRGRERTVPAVRRRARQQHLPEAARPGRRGRRRDRGRPALAIRRRPWPATTGADRLWSLVLDAAQLDEVVDRLRPNARVRGAGQVRLRPGPGLQRRLPRPASAWRGPRRASGCGGPAPSDTCGSSSRRR